MISQRYWDQLPEGSQVIDHIPFRAGTLFGNPVLSNMDLYDSLENWTKIIQNPEPTTLARENYSFVYIDEVW